jgi:hypothetical protein
MCDMTAGTYSIGFTLANPYATRATIRLCEVGDYAAAPLRRDAGVPRRGELCGFLEDCSPGRIAGWARDTQYIDGAVRVAVLLDGAVVAEMDADGWRQDLEDAAIGNGCHAFEFRPVPPLSAEKLARITVVRAADGVELQRLTPPTGR